MSSGRTHGPIDLPAFLEETFDALELERNVVTYLLQIGDSLLWVEAGDLPPDVEPWVVGLRLRAGCRRDVRAGRTARGQSISAPETKPYGERQAGFVDPGGNTWWVSTYLRHESP